MALGDDYHIKRQSSGVYNRAPENPRNTTDLATGQLVVTSTPQQINYVSVKRRGMKLTNLSPYPVFFGPTSAVTISSGDLLSPGYGSWVTFEAQSVLWVVCASGVTAQISWSDTFE